MTAVASGLLFSCCLSIPRMWMQYLRKSLRDSLQNWHKNLLGLEELIRLLSKKVKGQGHHCLMFIHVISQRCLEGFSFKYDTNIHLASLRPFCGPKIKVQGHWPWINLYGIGSNWVIAESSLDRHVAASAQISYCCLCFFLTAVVFIDAVHRSRFVGKLIKPLIWSQMIFKMQKHTFLHF